MNKGLPTKPCLFHILGLNNILFYVFLFGLLFLSSPGIGFVNDGYNLKGINEFCVQYEINYTQMDTKLIHENLIKQKILNQFKQVGIQIVKKSKNQNVQTPTIEISISVIPYELIFQGYQKGTFGCVANFSVYEKARLLRNDRIIEALIYQSEIQTELSTQEVNDWAETVLINLTKTFIETYLQWK